MIRGFAHRASLAGVRERSRRISGWEATAVFSVLVVAFTLGVPPERSHVFTEYRRAAIRWVAAQSLYGASGLDFFYLPTAAVLLAPFGELPYRLGRLALQVVNVAVFAFGVERLSRLLPVARYANPFGTAMLLALPLSWSAARHGQLTLLMGGLMMLGTAELAGGRQWRAALWLSCAVAIKPPAIVLLLLVAVLVPTSSWRILLTSALCAVTPFAGRDPDYVVRQYSEAAQMLPEAARLGGLTPHAQLFWTLRSAGVTVSPGAELVTQILGGFAALAVCGWALRKLGTHRGALYMFTFATAYILLFGPKTERNTYALIAPSMGLFTAGASAHGRRRVAGLFLGIIALMLVSHPLSNAFLGGSTVWVKPLACFGFTVAVLRELLLESPGAALPARSPDGRPPV